MSGTCIKDTYNYVMRNSHNKNLRVIHSTVLRPSDRLRHPHSVIYNNETGNILEVSNSYKKKNVELPFMIWVVMGNVKNIKLYKPSELTSLILKTRKWDFYHLPDFKNYYE